MVCNHSVVGVLPPRLISVIVLHCNLPKAHPQSFTQPGLNSLPHAADRKSRITSTDLSAHVKSFWELFLFAACSQILSPPRDMKPHCQRGWPCKSYLQLHIHAVCIVILSWNRKYQSPAGYVCMCFYFVFVFYTLSSTCIYFALAVAF